MTRLHSTPRRALRALALAASAAALAGCGTPAVVKPVATPLPGFKHDIQAAQNVVTQSEQSAAALSSSATP